MKSRSRLVLNLALLLAALAFGSAAYVLIVLTWSTPKGDSLTPSANAAGYLTVSLVASFAGAVIAFKRPENLIGRLFLSLGVLGAFDDWFSRYLLYTLEENPDSGLPSFAFLGGALPITWLAPMACVCLLLIFFPQGRPSSQRWLLAAWTIVIATIVSVVIHLFTPGPLISPFDERDNPIGIDFFDGLGPLAGLCTAINVAIALAAVVALFRRFLHSTGVEREQIKWFAYSAFWLPPVLIMYGLYTLLVGQSGPVIVILDTSIVLILITLPIAVGIAVVQYRLYDIDVIVNRTLVYVPLTAILAGLFTATTALTRTIFTDLSGQGSDAAIAATTIAIVGLFTPVKNQLQSFVDRLFKEASDPAKPLQALAADARKVFGVLDAEGFVQEFADKAAVAIGASNAIVYLNGKATPVVVSGDAMVECVLSFPLVESGTHVGRLEVGPSQEFRPYSPQQVAALEKQVDVLARGLVFYAAAMGLEIQRPDQNGPGVTVSDELGVL